MKIREYCVGAGHTDHITEEMAKRGYYVLGLNGESAELLHAVCAESKAEEIPYEAGDVAWYCARLLFNLGGYDVVPEDELNSLCAVSDDVVSRVKPIDVACDISIFAGNIADRQKKILRDKNGLYSQDDVTYIIDLVYKIFDALALLSRVIGKDLDTIACMNLGKLASRESRGMIGGNGDHR